MGLALVSPGVKNTSGYRREFIGCTDATSTGLMVSEGCKYSSARLCLFASEAMRRQS